MSHGVVGLLGLRDDKYDLKLGRDWMRNKGVMHTHINFLGYIIAYNVISND